MVPFMDASKYLEGVVHMLQGAEKRAAEVADVDGEALVDIVRRDIPDTLPSPAAAPAPPEDSLSESEGDEHGADHQEPG